jgi:Zn finger protein HypA/HybF involved in hydrogenase expression/very-short-patch-repair endonuclease
MIKEEHIHGKDSKIPVKCTVCTYFWTPRIHGHLYHKNGCPNCARLAPITLETYLERANLRHGDKYDYSAVTREHIRGVKSKVPVKCNKCGNIWQSSIDSHINRGCGCPTCFGTIPWKLETVLKRAYEIHHDRYDYSRINEADIINSKSEISPICLKCGHAWSATIHDHIYCSSGCPRCRFSKGEKMCAEVLDQLGISYEIEYKIRSCPTRRYDFMFVYNGISYLLEFDGKQHFEYNLFFHTDHDNFLYRQRIDIAKTFNAIDEGYRVVRISHKDIDAVRHHILNSVASDEHLYVSDPNLYQYILLHKIGSIR